jgi:hypothetical protein
LRERRVLRVANADSSPLARNDKRLGLKGARGFGGAESRGILRFAQNDRELVCALCAISMSEDPDMGHPVALCAMDACCAWQTQIPRLWARNDSPFMGCLCALHRRKAGPSTSLRFAQDDNFEGGCGSAAKAMPFLNAFVALLQDGHLEPGP